MRQNIITKISTNPLIQLTEQERHEVIDKILKLIKDERPYCFQSVVKKIDPAYIPNSESLWRYMVNEKLINPNDDDGEAFFGNKDSKISHHGIKVLEHGGWIKFKNNNHSPITERKWFALGGWIFAGLATLVAVVQYFWPIQDKIQRQEFIANNPPQLELWYSAFHPGNRDPLLKGTLLDNTIGITGSYRLINKGRVIITLEKIDLPNAFKTRGYFTDQLIKLPYALSPNDTIVISCEIPGKERPIIETEKVLKENVIITCSYPAADIRYSYKFYWHDGLFIGKARVIE